MLNYMVTRKVLYPHKRLVDSQVEGADLCDPEADAAFAPAIREHLRPGI